MSVATLAWIERVGAVMAFLGILLMADKLIELIGRERVHGFLHLGIFIAALVCGVGGIILYADLVHSLTPAPQPVGLWAADKIPDPPKPTVNLVTLGAYPALLVPTFLSAGILHIILIGNAGADWVKRLWFVGLALSVLGGLCVLVVVFSK